MALAFRPFSFSAPPLVVIVALCFIMTGCGSKQPGIVHIGGAITLDGEPVTDGEVRFYPEEGRTWAGDVSPDGKYKLNNYKKSGQIKPGNYIVTINRSAERNAKPTYSSYEDEMRGNTNNSSKPKATPWKIPRRYSKPETSDLSVEVVPGSSSIDLKLTSGR